MGRKKDSRISRRGMPGSRLIDPAVLSAPGNGEAVVWGTREALCNGVSPSQLRIVSVLSEAHQYHSY